MLLLDKAWIGSQDTVYMSVGCVCVVFVLDVVWFKNVNTSEPLQKEDVTAMTSSSRRERLGDFKSHSYVTLPSCVSLSQPTFICFQWPVTNLSELQQSIQNLSWELGSTRLNMRRIAITQVFSGVCTMRYIAFLAITRLFWGFARGETAQVPMHWHPIKNSFHGPPSKG